jgi:putative phosphoribosyl transferase
VDDGLATGSTMIAAIAWARRVGASRVVVAVPVGAPETVLRLQPLADEVICLEIPPWLSSVGAWYAEFGQVSDRRVTELLDGSVGATETTDLVIEAAGLRGPADLSIPAQALGMVIFAHGSGSSRHSQRNRYVADRLHDTGLATLLFDLLTPDEALDRARVFDIALLADRLAAVRRWVGGRTPGAELPVGYFGASTGAAAALWASAGADDVAAIVSRGGRPDLAGLRLAAVRAPTLLIVGGADGELLELNRQAQAMMRCPTDVQVIPGATHLFEEQGALEQVADLAAGWFRDHLPSAADVV